MIKNQVLETIPNNKYSFKIDWVKFFLKDVRAEPTTIYDLEGGLLQLIVNPFLKNKKSTDG